MKIKKYITVIATLILTISLIFIFPYLTISPGKLAQGHQKYKNDCFKCHTMFSGVQSNKCNSCHDLFGNNSKFIGRERIAFKNSKSLTFHQNLENPNCMGCHSGHMDANLTSSQKRFSHKFFNVQTIENCASCHKGQKPLDKLHEQVKDYCAECHNTKGWKFSSFSHNRFNNNLKCSNCHIQDVPNNVLHNKSGNKCSICHTTITWRNIIFDHTEHFIFDRKHRPACNTCHINKENFNEYSCYGCHAHSPRKIAGEHREEGIFDFSSCIDCHRSGDEDEAARFWKTKNITMLKINLKKIFLSRKFWAAQLTTYQCFTTIFLP